jgi:hypothetical protein
LYFLFTGYVHIRKHKQLLPFTGSPRRTVWSTLNVCLSLLLITLSFDSAVGAQLPIRRSGRSQNIAKLPATELLTLLFPSVPLPQTNPSFPKPSLPFYWLASTPRRDPSTVPQKLHFLPPSAFFFTLQNRPSSLIAVPFSGHNSQPPHRTSFSIKSSRHAKELIKTPHTNSSVLPMQG